MTEHFNQVDKQLQYTNMNLNMDITEYVIGNGKFQDKAFWSTEDHLLEAHECINKFLQMISNVTKHRDPPNSCLPWAKCFNDILKSAHVWFRVGFFRTMMIANHHLSPMEKNIFVGKQYAVDKANHEINSRVGQFPTKQQYMDDASANQKAEFMMGPDGSVRGVGCTLKMFCG
jgi:hypothetical protein